MEKEDPKRETQADQNYKKVLIVNGISIDAFLDSDDLNECVDSLLLKYKCTPSHSSQKVIRHNASGKNKEKRKRQRKNRDQHKYLEVQFKKNPNWDKAILQKLSKDLGLKES